MPSAAHAAPRRASRLRLAAMIGTAVLAAAAVTQAISASPAVAASALSCDQNTVYAINTGNNELTAIDVTTGASTDVVKMDTSNNGLAIAKNGVAAYAFLNGGNSITTYDAVNQTTPTTTATVDPAGNQQVLRGAVNPVTGVYYYASGGASAYLGAYDPATGRKIGQVGTISGLLANKNGDFAFSTSGVLFVVSGNEILRVDAAIPTTAGTAALPTTIVATLPDTVNSPGIAFSTDGYLYVSSGSNLLKLDSSSGQQVSSTQIGTGAYSPSDLASCNYANTMTAQASVDQRWTSGDQFGLALSGGGLTEGNTATTAGSATAVQPQKAGPALGIPQRTYTATETAAGTTKLANYRTTYECVNTTTNTSLAKGSGTTASFSYPSATTPDGSDVVCTFTNVLVATHVVTAADSGSTTVGTALTVPAAGVLANDSGTGLQVTGNTTPAHGTATVNPDGSYTYTPTAGFSGTDTFQYTATDSSGQTSTNTVTITVSPAATDDAATVTAGTTLAVKAPGLLANDGGSGLRVTGNTTPSHGTVTVNPDGSYSYTPTDGYSGPDAFQYTATDAAGRTTTGTVSITVTPAAVDDSNATPAGTAVGGDVLANDHGTGLQASIARGPVNGTVVLDADGSYTYTPADGFSGTDTFTYTATDSAKGTATATVTIAVTPVAQPDTVTAVAGSPATADPAHGLLANDGGTGLRVTGTTTPAHGTLTVNPDGSYSYTPADGFSGDDSFEYTVTDQAGRTSTATVALHVLPAAVDDAVSTPVNTPVTIDSAANDLGTRVAVTAVGTPGHGTASVTSDGRVLYTPDTNFSGADSFPYTITDAAGRTATATDTVTIAPRARADATSTDAGQPLTITAASLLANDSGSGLRVTDHTDPTHGTLAPSAGGDAADLVYTPADGFSGTDTFKYTVTDAAGSTSTATVTVIVGDVATPDAGTTPAGTTLSVDAEHGVLANDKGTGLQATLDLAPRHGSVTVGKDGDYVYVPADGYSGADSFTYTAKDESGNTATGLVQLTVTPVAVADTVTATAGTPATISPADLTGNDLGRGLRVTDHGDAGHGTVATNPDGTLTYSPADGFSGDDSFEYTVTDQAGQSTVGTVTVHVSPKAAADSASGVAGTPLVVDAPGVLGNDSGVGLTVTDHTDPTDGTVEIGEDGSFTYTPDTGFSGDDRFTYTTTDGKGRTATGTVTVHIAPTAVADTATTPAGTPVDVAAARNDLGTGLVVTAVGAPAGAAPAHGAATITAGGAVEYTPADGFSGEDSFEYTVTDGVGRTSTATVTVTVTPTAAPDVFGTPAGTALAIAPMQLTGNDRGSELTVAPATAPRHGTAVPGADGGIVYTPATGFSGTDTFTYTATDASGQHVDATVTVLVGTVATPDSGATTTNHGLTVTAANGVLVNDAGTGLAATLDRKPAHGTVQLAADGSFTYTPATEFSGTDTFTYTATDASGGTATGLVTITVTPTASDDRGRTPAGTTLTVAAAKGVLGNDHGTGLRVTTAGPAAHGTIVIAADGSYTYTPAPGFSGTDRVDYGITDASGRTASATLTIVVGICANDDSGSTLAGVPMHRTAAKGLLSNDDGTGLTAARRTTPSHGTATVAKDGSYTYTPAPGFTGTDSFTYTVTDTAGQTTTATATITVLARAAAVDDRGTGVVGKPVTVQPLGNDHASGSAHFDDPTLHLIDPATGKQADSVTVAGKGTWTVGDGGTVTFSPVSGFGGTATIGYRVTDSDGQTVTATITVTYPDALLTKGVLAFTGSTGSGWLAAGAMAAILAGVVLVVLRRRPGTR